VFDRLRAGVLADRSQFLKGAPHGMPMTLKNEINAELLEFFRQDQPATSPKRETVAST
jgi:hypothetical protein